MSSPGLSGNTPFKGVKGLTPVPSPTSALTKELPGAHPHHHHHHHHVAPRSTGINPAARSAPPPRSPSPVVIPKPRQIVSSKAVLDSVADRPRVHLGDVVYEPMLKRARLQDPRTGRPPRTGYSSTPKPLPWELIEGRENCTLTVKVGKEHLVPAAREEITSRRALWGTDVYTDDSDVVAACIHAGWIRGEWPEDVDVSMLGLDEGYSVSDVKGVGGAALAASSQPPQNGSNLMVLTEPPKGGPMQVPPNRDLHVTLLILPRLEKYASSTRFGIKSREFGGFVAEGGAGEGSRRRAVHDGISFMVIGLRWVTNGGESQNRLRGKARRERIRKALREVALTPAWAVGRLNGDAAVGGGGGESEARDRQPGEMLPGGWWKQSSATASSKAPSEGDKENRGPGGSGDRQRRESAMDQNMEQGSGEGELQERRKDEGAGPAVAAEKKIAGNEDPAKLMDRETESRQTSGTEAAQAVEAKPAGAEA